MKTVYFILGMHRSGTSALGGVLNILGLNAGSLLMPANDTNPKGYFENRHIYWHNEKILNEYQSSWDDYCFNIDVISEVDKAKYVQKAQQLIEQEYKYSQQFFIKDPRICMLFPIWKEACENLNINIKIIIPLRNPLEVAESLRSRNDFSHEKSLILWLHHFYQAEYYSREYSRVFLYFDELIEKTDKYLKCLETFTEIGLNEALKQKIEDFLERDYKHVNIPLNNFSQQIPVFLQKTLNLLQKSEFDDAKVMDEIRNDFYYILDMFHHKEIDQTLHQLESDKKQIELLNKQAKEHNENNSQLQEQLNETTSQLQKKSQHCSEINDTKISLEKRNNKLNEHLNALKKQMAETQERLKEKSNHCAEINEKNLALEKQGEEVKNKLHNTNQALDSNQAKVLTLENEIKHLKDQLVHKQKTVNAQDIERENFQKTLENLNQTISTLHADKTAIADDLQKSRKDLSIKKQDLSDIQKQFEAINKENQRLSDDLKKTQIQLDASDQEIGSVKLENEKLNQKNNTLNNLTQTLENHKKKTLEHNKQLKQNNQQLSSNAQKLDKQLTHANDALEKAKKSELKLQKIQKKHQHLKQVSKQDTKKIKRSDKLINQISLSKIETEKSLQQQSQIAQDYQSKLINSHKLVSQLKQQVVNEQQQIQHKIVLTKGKITQALEDFSQAWKNHQTYEMAIKQRAISNIKAFHDLFCKYISNKDKERQALNSRIKKLRSNIVTYLNPLRLANLLMSLNRLHSRLLTMEQKFNQIPWNVIESFDAQAYLEKNNDVKSAIDSGSIVNALEHFILHGYEEIFMGNRGLYPHTTVYNHQKNFRSHEEKVSDFHQYLAKGVRVNVRSQVKINDVSVDFSLLDQTPYPAIEDAWPSQNYTDDDLIEKPKNYSSELNRWMMLRGIDFIVCEHTINFGQVNQQLQIDSPSQSESELEKTHDDFSDKLSVTALMNPSVSDKRLMIFGDGLEQIDLKYLPYHYHLTIICKGVTLDKNLIQLIQPDAVICAVSTHDHEVISSEVEWPQWLNKYHRYQQVLSKTYMPAAVEQLTLLTPDDIVLSEAPNVFKFNIENISASGVKGWIFNANNKSNKAPIPLYLIINNEEVIASSSSLNRPDVKRIFEVKAHSGFQIEIPSRYLDGKKYPIKLVAKNNEDYHVIADKLLSATSQWVSDKNIQQKVILFCSHNLRCQGAQNSLYELAIGLKRLYKIVPIVYSPSDGPMAKKYQEHGIKVIIDNSLNINVDDINVWKKHINVNANKLKQLNCDVLIANTLQSYHMIHAADINNTPTMWIPRESEPPKNYFDFLPEPIRNEALRTFDIATQVVFVADATRKLWDFMQNHRPFKVIHNSLNISVLSQDSVHSRYEIRKAFGLSDDDIVLLSLGTVSPRKGQLDFVKAIPKVLENTNKRVKFFVVGMGSHVNGKLDEYSQNILDLVNQYPKEVKDQIHLIPETDKQINTKAYDFYALADVFVFTSRIESFPRVILEALYFGLPIVTTPCFGVVEQCIKGYNSHFYDEEDIHQLESHLIELVSDDQKRAQYSQGSKRLFENMQSYDQMLTNYHNIITNIYSRT